MTEFKPRGTMQQNHSRSLKATSVPTADTGSGALSTLRINNFWGSSRVVLQCSMKEAKTSFGVVNDELGSM